MRPFPLLLRRPPSLSAHPHPLCPCVPSQAAESLLERSRREGWGHWAYSSTAAPQPAAAAEQWEGWAGLHSLEPALVPGLDSGVRQVALGTAHALAVVA